MNYFNEGISCSEFISQGSNPEKQQTPNIVCNVQ